MKMTSCSDEKPLASKNFDKSNLKCVLVGDTMVGKTCLAKRLASHGFPAVYSPTMFDNYAATTTIDGRSFVLGLFDTAGQEEYDRLRTLAYVNCDVFLICFSVVRPESLKNAQDCWIREIRTHAPNVPCVLVGTHIDQRDDPAIPTGKRSRSERKTSLSGYALSSAAVVSTKEGMAAANRLGADSYVECSSLTEAGIIRLKEAAIDAVMNGGSSGEDCAKCACTIL